MDILEHRSCGDVQENSGILRVLEITFKFRKCHIEIQEHTSNIDIQEHVTLRFRNIQVVLMYRKFRNIDIQEHRSCMISGTFRNGFVFLKITFKFTLTFRNTEVVSGTALYSGTLKLHSNTDIQEETVTAS